MVDVLHLGMHGPFRRDLSAKPAGDAKALLDPDLHGSPPPVEPPKAELTTSPIRDEKTQGMDQGSNGGSSLIEPRMPLVGIGGAQDSGLIEGLAGELKGHG